MNKSSSNSPMPKATLDQQFKMNKSSNPAMPKATIEQQLKQFQKKGFSVSLVQDNSRSIDADSPTTREIRLKQAPTEKQIAPKVQTVDDAKKIIKTNVREKAPVSQNRLGSVDTRPVIAPKHITSNTFSEGNQSNTTVASENKNFSSQTWTNANKTAPSDNKAQNTNRVVPNISTPSNRKVQNRVILPQSGRKAIVFNAPSEKFSSPKVTALRSSSGGQRILLESSLPQPHGRILQSYPVKYPVGLSFTASSSDGNATAQSASSVTVLPEKNTPRMVNVPSSQVSKSNESKGQTNQVVKEVIESNSPVKIARNPDVKKKNIFQNFNSSSNVIDSRTISDQRSINLKPSDKTPGKTQTLRQIELQKRLVNPRNDSLLESKVQGSSPVSDTTKSFQVKHDYQAQETKHGLNLSGLIKRPVSKEKPMTSTPIAKKKCTRSPQKRKAASLDASGGSNSLQDSSNNEQHFINNLVVKNRPLGLSITPVPIIKSVSPGSSTRSSSAKVECVQNEPIIEEPPDDESSLMYCANCNTYSPNEIKWCSNCNEKLSPMTSAVATVERPYIVRQSMETITNVTVSKQIIVNQQSVHIEHQQKKVFIKTGPVVQTSPRPKGRPKSRRIEPVCLTLSSDDDEPFQGYNVYQEKTTSNVNIYPMESEGSKSEQSDPELNEEYENPDSDGPEFPGVTNIHPKEQYEEYDEQDEEEMDVEDEMVDEEISEELDEDEEEEILPEEEDDENMCENINENANMMTNLKCRSVRIGSLKVHPSVGSHIDVTLDSNSIKFQAPMVNKGTVREITLKANDLCSMLCHFGRCLPIVFLYTTPTFGEAVRKTLNMTAGEQLYFDPESSDEKQEKITFLIDSITEDHRKFLRTVFPGEKKLREIDQKTANELLVKSTPNHSQHIVLKPEVPVYENRIPITVTPVPQQQQVTIKLVPSQPVTKILTYPPPPQTGGIAITSEDLVCLNEGEFLNDVIIDFYLKYVFLEKLSEYNREKTHIFSSYFYPRLTSRPEKSRSKEDGQKPVQVRRHSQVKTWTRHIDIFSKDFIIIPVNQNVHWFLAIICYPGLVPDAPPATIKEETTECKPADNVTSTDDQDEVNKSTIKDQNTSSDGNNPVTDENSLPSSNNSFYEAEESPDSEEPIPEAPDSSTHPDSNRKRKEMPCICIFDSLKGPNRFKIAATLREYLEMEWKMKKGTRKLFDKNTMQVFILKCPQQTNFSDCGVYLLQYVESFFENPIPYYGNPMSDLTNWFSENKIAKKRQELKELILTLQKKQSSSSS